MKMIIDINPEMKDWIVNGFPDEEDMPRILRVIKHATPLEECGDAISRQAAIDACLNGWNKDYKEIVKEIRALPPVTPQYTDTEIQKMQDLEFAEIQKAYEIGKAENPNRWGSVIEDIKSEINELSELDHIEPTYEDCKRDVLEILDKYKASPTGAEGSNKE